VVSRQPSSVNIDLSSLQVLEAKLLENDIPVFIVTFATQEMLLFRNAKTAEIVVGAEDKVEQCNYVAVVTRLPEELDNELTGGWKIVEVCFSPMLLIGLLLTLPADGTKKRTRLPLGKKSIYSSYIIDYLIGITVVQRYSCEHNHYSLAFCWLEIIVATRLD
jgi:hypothetical protein